MSGNVDIHLGSPGEMIWKSDLLSESMLERGVRRRTEQASSYITLQHRIVLTMKLIVINILWWQRRTYYIGRQLRIWVPFKGENRSRRNFMATKKKAAKKKKH
jgi:hypothetical protein